MRILNIIETAYRATLEEQDDTVIWFTQAMRVAGADVSILLAGNAVNYGVMRQDASGLCFGDVCQTQPPRLAADVARLIEAGARMHVVEDDLNARGIRADELLPGLKLMDKPGFVELVQAHDHVWRW